MGGFEVIRMAPTTFSAAAARLFPLVPALVLALSAAPQERAAGTEAMWRTDLDAAVQEAKESQLPLLVLFRCEP